MNFLTLFCKIMLAITIVTVYLCLRWEMYFLCGFTFLFAALFSWQIYSINEEKGGKRDSGL